MIAKNKILIIIVGFLLVTNIGMLIFILSNKPEQPATAAPRPPGFAERLETEVGFSEEQLATYKSLRDVHRAEMKARFEALRETKAGFYRHIYGQSVDSVRLDSLARPIGLQQAELDKKVFLYFTRVRALSNPEQLPKFDSLLPQIVSRMTGGVRRDHDRNNQNNNQKPKE